MGVLSCYYYGDINFFLFCLEFDITDLVYSSIELSSKCGEGEKDERGDHGEFEMQLKLRFPGLL